MFKSPAFFLLSLLAGAAVSASGAQFFRKPYLQLATDTSMTIVWRTSGTIDAKVMFGTSVDKMDQTVPSEQILLRQVKGKAGESLSGIKTGPELHSARSQAVQYEVTISGLEPDTRYYYSIFDGSTQLTKADKLYTFRTHPAPGTDRPAYFWVVGDSGTGGRAQSDVHEAMISHIKKNSKPLDFYLHLGDMAYGSGKNDEFSANFFDMYAETLRNTVCWPALGNHEGVTSSGQNGVGPYFDCYVCPTKAEAGGVASGTESYYSFDYGKIHFIALNSHDVDRRKGGAMAEWLEADLENTREEWLVEDRWWTYSPLRRHYFELVLESGRCVTIFRDIAEGGWFEQ